VKAKANAEKAQEHAKEMADQVAKGQKLSVK